MWNSFVTAIKATPGPLVLYRVSDWLANFREKLHRPKMLSTMREVSVMRANDKNNQVPVDISQICRLGMPAPKHQDTDVTAPCVRQ